MIRSILSRLSWSDIPILLIIGINLAIAIQPARTVAGQATMNQFNRCAIIYVIAWLAWRIIRDRLPDGPDKPVE